MRFVGYSPPNMTHDLVLVPASGPLNEESSRDFPIPPLYRRVRSILYYV